MMILTNADGQPRGRTKVLGKSGFVGMHSDRFWAKKVGVPCAPVSGVPQVGDIGRVYMGWHRKEALRIEPSSIGMWGNGNIVLIGGCERLFLTN